MKKQKNEIEPKKITTKLFSVGNANNNLINDYDDTQIASNNGLISWGHKNDTPQILKYLYDNSLTMGSIINNNNKFIKGNGITINIPLENTDMNDFDIKKIINYLSKELQIYNGCAIQVRRNKFGIAKLKVLEMKNVRVDKDEKYAYHSTKWSTYSKGKEKYPLYDNYDENVDRNNTIYYYNEDNSYYPEPTYKQGLNDIKKEIYYSQAELTASMNPFNPKTFIEINKDVDDDEQDRIIKEWKDKYCKPNGDNLIFSFNSPGSEETSNITSLEPQKENKEKYNIKKEAKTNIFEAFNMPPVLLGQGETGFLGNDEFNDKFIRYNQTIIKELQQKITDILNDIFDMENSIIFTPYSTIKENKEITNDN